MEDFSVEEKEINESEPNEEKPTDIAEEISLRYSGRNRGGEHFGDVLVMQIAVCIILALAFAVANIIVPETVESLVKLFCEMTGGEPEDLVKKAVSKALSVIND